MKRTLQKITGAVSLACSAGVALTFASNASAQDPGTPETMKPMVITGSLIPTVDAASSVSPVLVLDAKEIEKSGAATVTEVLLKIPQNNAGSFNEGFLSGNSFSKGSSSVSLRGLGPNATLVLLNGRRVATYGFAQNITDQFVDLNSIPLAAVERIDVLKDGASALYGSDAIAGVINIVLKKEYSGVEINTRLGNTLNNDALEQTYSAIWGVMTDKGSAMIIADWYNRNGLYLRDRSYSKSANHESQGGYDLSSSAGNPGTIITDDDAFAIPSNPAIPNRPTAAEIQANPGTVNYYDFNPWISAIGETRRYGMMAIANYDLTENLSAFIEASARRINYSVSAAPTPVFGDLDGFVVGAANPYNPFGEDVAFRYRLTEAGPRIDEGETDAMRFLPGLKLKLGEDWTVESALLWSESRTLEIGKNFISADALRTALTSSDPATALNIFGVGESVNDPAVIDGLKIKTFRAGNSTLLSPDLRAGGTLPLDWGAGRVGLAVGGEYRQEEVSDTADSFSENNLVVSSGGTSGYGYRDAWAGYGEVAIPVLGKDLSFPGVKQFDIQVAGRYENYSDFGDTFKPKVGAKWKVVDQLTLRATYAESFRAPSLVELFQGTSTSYDQLADPARGDTGMQYRIERGGNATLTPEEAKSWTAGFVAEPLKNLTVYVDWFNIKQTDKILDLDPQDILDNEALFPGRVIRNAPTAQDILDGKAGSIIKIISGYENVATREVEGLDFGGRYVIPTDSWGEFSVDARASWLYKFDETPKPGDPVIEWAGTYSTPEWRGLGSVYWDYQDWSVGFTANYVGKYDQNYMATETYVSDWWTFDLQASYDVQNTQWEWLNNTKFTVGMLNIADEDPPFSDYDTEGYDTSIGDPRGRFVYLQVTKRF